MGSAVAKVDLKYVDVQRDRAGRVVFHYFRRNGRRWRLPGEPTSEAFMAEYHRLLAETAPRKASTPAANPSGSFGALVKDFLASGQFKEKRQSTQREYRRVLEALSAEHGSKPVRLLERRHVRQIRDARADTPGAANTVLRMLKLLLNFAVDDGIIKANPAAKMRLLKVGEWRAWTDEECAAFEARWPTGSMQRRAYALALYTGQRKSDLVAMSRAHRKDGAIRVVQGKTGAELWIPEHRNLTAELTSDGHMALLITSQGKAFDPVYFGAWFADAIAAASLPDDCVLHGLRKTAARTLAEAGCSEQEIAAITGHLSGRMVAHYTKAADQKKRATAAITKLENAR
jgi:integrase